MSGPLDNALMQTHVTSTEKLAPSDSIAEAISRSQKMIDQIAADPYFGEPPAAPWREWDRLIETLVEIDATSAAVRMTPSVLGDAVAFTIDVRTANSLMTATVVQLAPVVELEHIVCPTIIYANIALQFCTYLQRLSVKKTPPHGGATQRG